MINNPNEKGKIIVICSAKGGVGKTVIASNLAIALSMNHFKTTLLDGSFQFGNIHLAMDLQPIFTIKDVVEQLDYINGNTLSNYLIPHQMGLQVLAAPPKPQYGDLITIEALDKICGLLISNSDYLLIDTSTGFSEHSLYFLERADEILMVTDLEMASLNNTKLMIETINALGLRDKLKIILNRATMVSVISAKDVPNILGEASLLYIPNHFQIVSKSLNIGVPFIKNHRRTEMAKSIINIADILSSGKKNPLFKPENSSFMEGFIKRFHGPKE